ncbi:hypothetical protein BGZ83_003912, partial [Gryganskiella cystojenkinii]
MSWYIRYLPPQTALVLVTNHLNGARNSKDKNRAKKYCDKAKESLARIKIKTTSSLDPDQLIDKYRELAAILEKLQHEDEARLIYSKASELSLDAGRGPLTPFLVPPVAIPTVPEADSATATSMLSSSVSSLASSTIQSLDIASTVGKTIAPHNKGNGLSCVFTKDFASPVNPCKLPGLGERLINTQQLTLCLGLLRASPLPGGGTLNPSALTWLNITQENVEEQERLKAMATDLIRAYSRDELKGTNVTAEVVLLAPVLEKEEYHILLSQLVK